MGAKFGTKRCQKRSGGVLFSQVSFQNLRCFKDLRLEGLTPLTLISGRNNVGKTTVLEGIFMLCACKASDMFFKLSSLRSREPVVSLEPRSLWELLFGEVDMSQPLRISVTDELNNSFALCLQKAEHLSVAKLPGNISHVQLHSSQGTYPLALSYKYNEKEEKGHFVTTPDTVALLFDTPRILQHFPITVYMGPSMGFSSSRLMLDWLGQTEVEGKKAQVVEALRLLDPEIEDLFTATLAGKGFVYARRKNGCSLPVSAMGGGINKLLSYLLAMVAEPGCFLLIDEIETGLHYRFYPKLWELMADVAQKTGCQVLATTHSDECIRAAVEGTAKINPALLTYIRLGKEGDTIVPYRFANEELAYALEREMELR